MRLDRDGPLNHVGPSDRPDRRVRRTRTAIHRALMTLMLEKGYDAVTVTDIIDRADVGRSTFYAHFTDKQQVLYQSLDALAQFLRDQSRASGRQLFGFSRAMFEHAHEQRQLIPALLGRRGGTIVQTRIAHILAALVREELEPLAEGTAVPLELIVTGVVGTYLAMLAAWLDEDLPYSPSKMDDAFRRLVIPGVRAAMPAARSRA